MAVLVDVRASQESDGVIVPFGSKMVLDILNEIWGILDDYEETFKRTVYPETRFPREAGLVPYDLDTLKTNTRLC